MVCAGLFLLFREKIAAGNQSEDQTRLALLPLLCWLRLVLHYYCFVGKSRFHCACVEGKNDEIFVCMCVSRKFVLKMHGLPSSVIDWDTVFRLGHTPIQAVHNMICTAWIGECPNL